MENVFDVKTTVAGATPDFVVDLLSGEQTTATLTAPTATRERAAVPLKPAPRQRNKRSGGQIAGKYNASGSRFTARQALPPDDETLILNTAPIPAARLDSANSQTEGQMCFTVGDANDFQSHEYKTELTAKPVMMSRAPEDFDRTHTLSVSSPVNGGEELLLASVPYHTLRIEPSPALTLDTRKHRGSKTDDDTSYLGRLKSTSSLSDDLDSLQEMSSFRAPTRSSSTPMLIGDGM